MNSEWDPEKLITVARSDFHSKVELTSGITNAQFHRDTSLYSRQLESVANTRATIFLPESGTRVHLNMFGSNNYLGLASDPRVIEAAQEALVNYGAGLCGSSMLNGNSVLQRKLEIATADLKGAEDCIIFSSGFLANLAWVGALVRPVDTVIADSEAHTSFREGSRASGGRLRKFKHNSPEDLAAVLEMESKGDLYVFVEGLYSMTGDVPDISRIVDIAARRNGVLVIDDAHATGTIGKDGSGAAKAMENRRDILTIGTYSKALGSNGGFICGDRDLINCLRVLAAPYIFSASLSPANMGAALAAIAILREDLGRVASLQANAKLAHDLLRPFGDISDASSPIVFLRIGRRFSSLAAAKELEKRGYFVNAISFPAVSRTQSGLRISISSEHTREQISALAVAVAEVWAMLGSGADDNPVPAPVT